MSMGKVKETMSIGTLSKQTGIGIETIRFYERLGLVVPIGRKSSGYRIFDDGSLKALGFIKHAKELGFSLNEIQELLSLKADKKSKCQNVQVKAATQLESVNEKIKNLERIKTTLTTLIQQCKQRKTNSECPILDALEYEEKL
ncbi:MAG: MerR family transcriptional regulator [Bdellovibrionales bacterium CG11_big_fil_rev_8_21_14_0_20_38_13]|nr:MAG: MerR family transcriptional regulator [Bdellovibrionales bacterium CG11_big_fil_rev_8_21_14_0_20_38_13]